MDSKDLYKAKLDKQLKEWSIKILDLKGKAELIEASAKVEYLKQVKTLRARKDETQAKLEELIKAGDDAWETLKDGVEKAASELKDSINNAISKFK